MLLASENATSQSGSVQTATTKDGRVVTLKTDGTWEYAKETRTSNQTTEKATLLEMQTDQAAYVERPVVITGALEMFSYYFGGYRNSQDTHYAFLLRDQSRGASPADIYMQRGEAAANLRKLLLQNNGKIQGSFTIAILKERIQQPQDLFNKLGVVVAELIDFSVLNSQQNVIADVSPTSKASNPTLRSQETVPLEQESKTAPAAGTEDLALLDFLRKAVAEGAGNWIPVWGSQKDRKQYHGTKIKRRDGDLFAWWRLEIADPVMSKGVKRIITCVQVNCEFRRSRDLLTAAGYDDGRTAEPDLTLNSEWRQPREGTYGAEFLDTICKAGKKIKE